MLVDFVTCQCCGCDTKNENLVDFEKWYCNECIRILIDRNVVELYSIQQRFKMYNLLYTEEDLMRFYEDDFKDVNWEYEGF